MKKYSGNTRERERELRKQKSVNRRFNDPLKIFIEQKYNGIFQEYVELHKRMVEENPDRKDLTKSGTFKRWLAANSENVQSRKVLYIPQVVLEPTTVINKALGDEEARQPTN